MNQILQGNLKETAILTESGKTTIFYYNNPIVTFNETNIILDTHGHNTSTTIKRMNQTSNSFDLGYKVFSKNKMVFVYLLRNGMRDDTYPVSFDGDRLVLKRKTDSLERVF